MATSGEVLDEIKNRLGAVTAALKENNPQAILKACTDLGFVLQDNFRQEITIKDKKTGADVRQTIPAGIEDISKSLKKEANAFEAYKGQEIPSLDVLTALSQASITVRQDLSTINPDDEKNMDSVMVLQTMKLGAQMFFSLTNSKETTLSEADEFKATSEVYNFIPFSEDVQKAKEQTVKKYEDNKAREEARSDKEKKADGILAMIAKDCVDTKKPLSKLLLKEIADLPDRGAPYQDKKKDKIDLERFSKDLMDGTVKNHHSSKEIKAIAKDYYEASQLHGMTTGRSPPLVKLKAISGKYNSQVFGDDHSKKSRLFKKLDHLLKVFHASKLMKNVGKNIEQAEKENLVLKRKR